MIILSYNLPGNLNDYSEFEQLCVIYDIDPNKHQDLEIIYSGSSDYPKIIAVRTGFKNGICPGLTPRMGSNDNTDSIFSFSLEKVLDLLKQDTLYILIFMSYGDRTFSNIFTSIEDVDDYIDDLKTNQYNHLVTDGEIDENFSFEVLEFPIDNINKGKLKHLLDL